MIIAANRTVATGCIGAPDIERRVVMSGRWCSQGKLGVEKVRINAIPAILQAFTALTKLRDVLKMMWQSMKDVAILPSDPAGRPPAALRFCHLQGVAMKKLTILLLVVLAVPATAAPPLINFQAALRDSGGVLVEDNVYALKFRIYDALTDGTALWESTGFVPLQSSKGVVQHMLGSTSPLADSLFRRDSLWVGISIGVDPELTPRTRLVTVPYAMTAALSDSTSSVSASDVQSGQLDTARYSAYEDLASENKIGPVSGQVASGVHEHTVDAVHGVIGQVLDTALVSGTAPTNGNVVLKQFSFPPGGIGYFFRISFAFEVAASGSYFYSLVTHANTDKGIGAVNKSGIGTVDDQYHVEISCVRLTGDQWHVRSKWVEVPGLTNEIRGYEEIFDVSSGLTIDIIGSSVSGSVPIDYQLGTVLIEYGVP